MSKPKSEATAVVYARCFVEAINKLPPYQISDLPLDVNQVDVNPTQLGAGTEEDEWGWGRSWGALKNVPLGVGAFFLFAWGLSRAIRCLTPREREREKETHTHTHIYIYTHTSFLAGGFGSFRG